MGEFTSGYENNHTQNKVDMQGDQEQTGFDTDVPEVRADDQVKNGSDSFPVFDVTSDEFYQNMQDGRRRLRFKNGSNAQKYMQGSKYQRPFYVRHTDDNGKKYVRKIK